MIKASYYAIISADRVKALVMENAEKMGLKLTGEYRINDDGSASVGWEPKEDA